MRRIKISDLEAQVRHLNDLTNSPQSTWIETNGKYLAQIGNYHLSGAYGGYGLHRIVTLGGGVDDIFYGHYSKRELYEKIDAYLRGIEQGKNS